MVTDGFLARRAASGDHVAFAELAGRYRGLIVDATLWAPAGMEVEDLRQEALLGLYDACRVFRPGRGRFAGLARLNVRWRVGAARLAAIAPKHRLLSDAAREDPAGPIIEHAEAPPGASPALVVELRDTLRERTEHARRPRVDHRRRYTDEQIERALALIAEGHTLKQTALAVGAPVDRVSRWVTRAGMRHAGRHRYTPAEIERAVSLVRAGASLRQAGATVGATNATVLRWLRTVA